MDAVASEVTAHTRASALTLSEVQAWLPDVVTPVTFFPMQLPCYSLAHLWFISVSPTDLMNWFLLPMPNPKTLLVLGGSSHNRLFTLPHYVTSNKSPCLFEPQFSHLVNGIGEVARVF